MERKIFFKEPENLKMEIEKLISFEEKEGLLRLKKQLEGKQIGEPLSKYSRVLSCSYAKSSTETEMPKGVSAQSAPSPQAIGDSTSIQ